MNLEGIRQALAAKCHSPEGFRLWLDQLAPDERDGALDCLLGIDPIVADAPSLPVGCVPYLPAPVSAMLRLVELAPVTASSTFIDIGCGAGRAMALVHLLTGARCSGIDVQSHLVRLGNAVMTTLGLDGVSLREVDACEPGALPPGDVYFMYCPFNAERAKRVLAALEQVAAARPIVIGCLQMNLPACSWLDADVTTVVDLALYRSRV